MCACFQPGPGEILLSAVLDRTHMRDPGSAAAVIDSLFFQAAFLTGLFHSSPALKLYTGRMMEMTSHVSVMHAMISSIFLYAIGASSIVWILTLVV